MKLARTPEEQKQWLEQWRFAEKALWEQKRQELQNLTEQQALADSDMLLEMALSAWRDPKMETYSGLVEQQRLFHKLTPNA